MADSSFASLSAKPSPGQAPHVYLNIYNLLEANKESASGLGVEALTVVGMGIHHTGVEIFGEEWSFGMDMSGRNDPTTEGIFCVYPRTACGFFKEQIDLGPAPQGFTEEKFKTVLDSIRPQWKAISYHILSHNCNIFSRTLVEAIDATFPAGTPAENLLVSKVPSWINRAANAGAALVPNALIKKITESLNPPGAAAPDLVNLVDIPAYSAGPLPPPLGPLPTQDDNKSAAEAAANAKQSAGGFGMLSGLASKAANTVKSAVSNKIDEKDRKDYVTAFASANADDLLSAYTCTVIHINRSQSAKVYICVDGVRLAGAQGLKTFIPYTQIDRYFFGSVVRPQRADGNALPQFVPTNDMAQADCILLFCNTIPGRSGPRMIPLLDLSFMGVGSTVANKHREVARNALGWIDNAYRKLKGI